MKIQAGVRLFVAALFLLAAPVHAQSQNAPDCAATVPPTCAYVQKNQMVPVLPTAFTGATKTCVQNNCAADIMVPTGALNEWTSFLTNHETCAALSTCTPLTVVLTASPTSVTAGASSTLSWVISGAVGATNCVATSTDVPSTWGQTYTYPTVPAGSAGTATVKPVPPAGSTNTVYTLTCTDSQKNVGVGTVTLAVSAANQCPGTGSCYATGVTVTQYANGVNDTHNVLFSKVMKWGQATTVTMGPSHKFDYALSCGGNVEFTSSGGGSLDNTVSCNTVCNGNGAGGETCQLTCTQNSYPSCSGGTCSAPVGFYFDYTKTTPTSTSYDATGASVSTVVLANPPSGCAAQGFTYIATDGDSNPTFNVGVVNTASKSEVTSVYGVGQGSGCWEFTHRSGSGVRDYNNSVAYYGKACAAPSGACADVGSQWVWNGANWDDFGNPNINWKVPTELQHGPSSAYTSYPVDWGNGISQTSRNILVCTSPATCSPTLYWYSESQNLGDGLNNIGQPNYRPGSANGSPDGCNGPYVTAYGNQANAFVILSHYDDVTALTAVPPAGYNCVITGGTNYAGNNYSTPVSYGHTSLTTWGTPAKIVSGNTLTIDQSCAASFGPVNCGAAAHVASASAPSSGLCSDGSTQTVTSYNDNWIWACGSSNGVNQIPNLCSAPMMPGS